MKHSIEVVLVHGGWADDIHKNSMILGDGKWSDAPYKT
jgi:hypothetical protein